MKTFILPLLAVLFSASVTAQIPTEMRIYHKLGSQDFQFNSTTQNNMSQDFQVTRIEYYVSGLTVMHDGGQETVIHTDTVALINSADGDYSVVELGNLNITAVEGVKFHIGVPTPANNADPSLFPTDHPLAPKTPSMHWGWAAGYRFLVYEGLGGANFAQVFQLHGLGNANYFETTVTATGQDVGGTMYIVLDADYNKGVEDIDISNGVVAHGVDGADLMALQNFQSYVFSQGTAVLVADINEETMIDWAIFPNPSAEAFTIQANPSVTVDYVRVTNALGQEVRSLSSANETFTIQEAGVYFVHLVSGDQVIATRRIIKQ